MASKTKAGLELTNEQIRQAAKGLELLLAERIPRELGFKLQVRYQALKFALAPANTEHDRLVMLAVKRDKKKAPVREGVGFAIDDRKLEEFERETKALWATKQRVALEKIRRAAIPEKIEGKPLVVAGIVWDYLAPILMD